MARFSSYVNQIQNDRMHYDTAMSEMRADKNRAILRSRKSEQNSVWVGMAKETAHQLGTPLSALMGWVDYFKNSEKFKYLI